MIHYDDDVGFNYFDVIENAYAKNEDDVKERALALYKQLYKQYAIKYLSKTIDDIKFITHLRTLSIQAIFTIITHIIIRKLFDDCKHAIVTFYFNDNVLPLNKPLLYYNNIQSLRLNPLDMFKRIIPMMRSISLNHGYNTIARYIMFSNIITKDDNKSYIIMNSNIKRDKYTANKNFDDMMIELNYYNDCEIKKGFIEEFDIENHIFKCTVLE